MRLVDAASYSKARNEKKEDVISLDVISFFNRLINLFFLHCPDCGGRIKDVGQHNGSTVYECTVCHKEWI